MTDDRLPLIRAPNTPGAPASSGGRRGISDGCRQRPFNRLGIARVLAAHGAELPFTLPNCSFWQARRTFGGTVWAPISLGMRCRRRSQRVGMLYWLKKT